MEKVKPFCVKPEFMPDVVKKASVAAHGLCCWVRAMVSYDRVAKIVKPKKLALRSAEQELEIVMKSFINFTYTKPTNLRLCLFKVF